ncbi:MAG: M1 family metallopeptidase [Sandaracinaceae bacterium]|nr:M1 family metallopeptidase [Sandaracinaceae bacterium]
MLARLAALSLAALTASCGPSVPEPVHAPAARAPEPVDAPPTEAPFRLPDGVRPLRYALRLEIDPSAERFSGVAEIDIALDAASRHVWIHGHGLDVSEVFATGADGARVEGTWHLVDAEEGMARVTLSRPLGPGEARLTIRYARPFDPNLEGLYRVAVGDDHYAFTQFEALSARKAFPCFDEPRFKVPFEVTLVVPEGLRAFANARDAGAEREGNLVRHRFTPTAPLPTYLVAFAVGPLDVVEATIPPNAVRSTPLALRGLAPRGRGGDLAFAMEHTPRLVEALERWFEMPYPYDKLDFVAVPDFAAGAMENAGLITFRDQFLLLSGEPSVAQQRAFAFIMAHELAHQWFGNLVTMVWWDDLWLNEAFATWIETPIVEATFPALGARTLELSTQLEAFDADGLASARVVRQPIESSHDIANAFDGITYSKGASVLAMLSAFVGAERFQAGIRRYLTRHAGGNATTADLVAALAEDGHNAHAAEILERFTTQPGIPLVEVGEARCALDAGHPDVSIPVRQTRYRPLGSSAPADARWVLPVCVRHADRGGVLQTSCTLLDEAEGVITLPTCPAWVWPNPEGSAYYRYALTPAATRALVPHVRAALAPGRARRPWVDGARGGVASGRDLMALADSVEASVRSGAMTFSAAMELLAPLAASEERAVASAPIGLLTLASEHLLEEAQRERVERYGRRLYQPALRRLGWDARPSDTPETRALRAAVIAFLALEARDPAVRREAARRGRAFLGEEPGGDHHVHADAVAADLAETCVAVAAEEDPALFEPLLAALGATSDGVVRQRLLVGLARLAVHEPLRERVLDLTLDERLRQNERFRTLGGPMRDARARPAAWAWLEAHYDAVRARFGPDYAGYLPYVAGGYCTSEDAARVEAFFAPRIGDTHGGPRNLAATVETIRLCAARAEHHRADARAFFAR